MTREKMTAAEWVAKAQYEGGVEPGFEYGLTADDLADGVDPAFRAQVARAHEFWAAGRPWIEALEDMIEEIEEA